MLSRLRIGYSLIQVARPVQKSSYCSSTKLASFHTSSPQRDLMEFFDHKDNWGAMEVKSGRSWRLEDLRLKSNEDLHKLWFVLLKERNMLLTMEYAANEEKELLPGAERIDKVKESMKNLEEVVRERNRAYWMLETGEKGPEAKKDPAETKGYYAGCYSTIEQVTAQYGRGVRKFLQRLEEEKRKDKLRAISRQKNHVLGLLKRFPNLDEEAVQAKYPDVDIAELRKHKRSRGHFDNNTA
nr:EOG090X0DBE [Triops cancriformis]